jgi:hypothetical protein
MAALPTGHPHELGPRHSENNNARLSATPAPLILPREARWEAAVPAAGGFAADWNRIHLFNWARPPHARFHDAITTAPGTGLRGSALHLLRNGADRPEVAVGAALPALFQGSMARHLRPPQYRRSGSGVEADRCLGV